ncbi:MAG: hypothetical protein KDB53_01470 [Planctomycetes bacterium]|nr:hypothetical protein [Planctomycetota bacterium]
MRWSRCLVWSVCLAVGTLGSCGGGNGGNGGGGGGSGASMAVPRAGLSMAQLEAFERGREVFTRDFKPSEGLGPLYNATSCRSCHSTPDPGGSAPRYRNFFLTAIGPAGSQFAIPGLPSVVVPNFGSGVHAIANFSLEGGRFRIPTEFFGAPVATAQRNALATFGVGLFETVSDATILSNADPDDADNDGISGRFNLDNGTMGRFGVK